MFRIAERHAAGTARVSQVKTLAGVVRTTALAIIGVIVGMQFLAAIGVNLAPLLASAGIAGVAIGLAAQNLVKDMLNGTSHPGRRSVQCGRRGHRRRPHRNRRSR